jgi:hypothetical protein
MGGLQLSGTISSHIGLLTGLSYLCGWKNNSVVPICAHLEITSVIWQIICYRAQFHLKFLASLRSPQCPSLDGIERCCFVQMLIATRVPHFIVHYLTIDLSVLFLSCRSG